MLIDFLTMPLRAIDKIAAKRYARAVNYYLPNSYPKVTNNPEWASVSKTLNE